MIPLARRSDDVRRPFANLLPLVEAFLRGGNALQDDGFVLNPDGWRCRLTDRLDFGLICRDFEVPDSIQLSPERDTVLDKLTWCSIEGPGAHR